MEKIGQRMSVLMGKKDRVGVCILVSREMAAVSCKNVPLEERRLLPNWEMSDDMSCGKLTLFVTCQVAPSTAIRASTSLRISSGKKMFQLNMTEERRARARKAPILMAL